MRLVVLLLVTLCGGALRATAQRTASPRFRPIPAGHIRPIFLAGVADTGVAVMRYLLAETPVSNKDFLRFVIANPAWRRSRVSRVAADASYLRHWEGDTHLGPNAAPNAPVVNVSWFAARAYAEWSGARLPTTVEWELAASRFRRVFGDATDRFNMQLLAWYGASTSDAPITTSPIVSDDGVVGLHRGPWEWVDDFNTAVTSGESRGDSAPDDGLFCAGGAALAADPANYAAFMRYAVRGSLRGSYTLATLGFRLARDASSPSGHPSR